MSGSYKSYINLGSVAELTVVARRTVRNDGQHRWVCTKYAYDRAAWKHDDDRYSSSRMFIVQTQRKQFVVGLAQQGGGDILIEFMSGPFPILKAAKVSYLLEDISDAY